MIQSRLCKQKDFETEKFKKYVENINHNFRYHRKLWEFVAIIDTLHELNLLKEGTKGLGFAVGTEPLSAYFIKHGCDIVSSDFIVENNIWSTNNEVAYNIDNLNEHKIISHDLLSQKCIFRVEDMNNIHSDLKQGKFDFIWSSCAIEHIGGLDKGLNYVVNSLDCLKSGGYSIHTTEYNCSSNDGTAEYSDNGIYRKKDFEKLETMLWGKAVLFPIDYDLGDMRYDNYIDTYPYSNETHLKLDLFGYISTSALLIIKKL